MKNRQLANYITGLRIVGTLCLLFMKPFSIVFYFVYSISGISDVLDGWVARKKMMESDFGARLDSMADLLFYSVMLVKILPALLIKLPGFIWTTVELILMLRLFSYGAAAVKYHRFAALHTYMNKLTGTLVFALPYVIGLPIAVPYCTGACLIAVLAAAEELLIHICSKEYNVRCKTVFRLGCRTSGSRK